MLGELNTLYKEKSEWKDKLKLVIVDDSPLKQQEIDLNYMDIGE